MEEFGVYSIEVAWLEKVSKAVISGHFLSIGAMGVGGCGGLRKQLAVKGMMRAQRTEVTLIGMQERKRQLAMGIKWGSTHSEWLAERIVYGDEQQGQRHLIWEKEIGWKAVEHIRQQELPDW